MGCVCDETVGDTADYHEWCSYVAAESRVALGAHNGPMQPAAVILAAGSSARFGSPKQLARVGGGSTMLEAVVGAAMRAGLDPIIAVVPPGLSPPEALIVVRNEHPEAGMSRSLRLGLAAVPPDRGAAVVLLADQPTVDDALLGRVIGARGSTPIVATRAGELLGPPVLLEREAFVLVDRLSGDVGLRRLLRANPQLVTPIGVDVPIPDVDEPADLERIIELCAGCGASFLPSPAAAKTHAYIGASPACWAAYGELLAREFQDPAYGRVHRHSADAYAAQHPGVDGRRQRQSVALHLVAIVQWLEHGTDVGRLNTTTQRLAGEERDWPWLTPPAAYAMSVVDVLEATSGVAHAGLVREWAASVWHAWSAHHEVIRSWAREAIR